ncbi:E3 ubiquitin-protein ligase RGLG1 isoform X1 [Prunus yedoensis var. nudiflora]|uniref:E3 ubiquitin-protein ligase RGLG1 isoform X1 n=1 Tax=Prunus yedoensis var. nudiflora TaxID=2094558 RepID=A0A314ZDR8_PRUYE|nr:E3 ubiquitin-protein ligase RGLG1 isoform X1 [Prunus yedoensis var. nudiflora]
MGNGESTYTDGSHDDSLHELSSHAGTSMDSNRQPKQQSAYIADNFNSLDQVISSLREAGLESSNLILGIDFTKSNEWTGRYSFHRKSLHAIGSMPNPYEQAISIIGRTLSPFDEDNIIPCFGFGDASTHDQSVFSFYPEGRYCHGFEEALARYREIVPLLKLSGPTSFAPIIDAAIDIVEKSNGQYHVLVIIADGQVTRSPDTPPGRFSQQEQATVNSIVAASQYPLSIILVGVGDGPWDAMQKFDDNIPQRSFDNFQFVDFTKIMSENTDTSKKEAAFALAALMEIPYQYRATQSLHFVGCEPVGGPQSRANSSCSSCGTSLSHLPDKSKGYGFRMWSYNMQGLWAESSFMPFVSRTDINTPETIYLSWGLLCCVKSVGVY